jgi:hypothetical protein
MPGENVLPVQYYPDDFRVINYFIHDASAADELLFYCDRNMVLDSATVSVAVVGAASSTVTIKAVAAGTAPSPANIAAGTAVTSAIALDATGAIEGTVVNTANSLPIGTHLGLDYTGTVSALRGMVTLRIRSRLK